MLTMPHSRPLPTIGPNCHELRIQDRDKTWRIVYQIEEDAIVLLEVFEKRTQTTPNSVIETCKRRLTLYDGVK